MQICTAEESSLFQTLALSHVNIAGELVSENFGLMLLIPFLFVCFLRNFKAEKCFQKSISRHKNPSLLSLESPQKSLGKSFSL